MSLPGFSFVFLFHASISSSNCSVAFSLLLALIYLFSPETGPINHYNAALGKMLLSAGRDALPLTAPAGRKTPASLPGSGDRLLMVFAFYVCACAIGAGPEGAFHVPPSSYFKSPLAVENKLLLLASPGSREKRKGRLRRESTSKCVCVCVSGVHCGICCVCVCHDYGVCMYCVCLLCVDVMCVSCVCMLCVVYVVCVCCVLCM